MDIAAYSIEKLEPGLCFPMGKAGTSWRVLQVNEEKRTALVIADKEICKMAYNEEGNDIIWEQCTLRKWLNGEYFEKTFSDQEKEAILECEIKTPDNVEYGTKGGADTKDKIWLLSIDEADRYLKDDDRVTGQWWWLRSPGCNQHNAVYVRGDGSINARGSLVRNVYGVRVAFVLNFNSIFFKQMFEDEANLKINSTFRKMDEKISKIILTDYIWSTLSPAQQARLVIENQAKPIQHNFKEFLNGKNSAEMVNAMATEIRDDFSSRECNAVAWFMTEFTGLISAENAKNIYAKLQEAKKAEKALKKIQGCKEIMALINLSDSEKISDESKVFIEVLSASNITKSKLGLTLKEYFSLKLEELPKVLYKNGAEAENSVLLFLLLVHGIEERCYKKVGLMPEAEKVVGLLDKESFMQALKTLADSYLVQYQNSKKKYLAYPICRYADETLMKELTKRAPGWRTHVSGNNASPLAEFRDAIKYSDTQAAMLFADKFHDLSKYAKLRGMSEDDFRDIYLSDIGLDASGRKEYDLGSQKVSAVLQKDLSFMIETSDGKSMKSVPKKGADPELYACAAEDFKNIKSQAKKIVKKRAEKLFEDFLSGKERSADGWRKAYLENVLLRSVAEHMVWSQGTNTFTVSDNQTVSYDGELYSIEANTGIKVAHPMEMPAEEISAWQEYFKDHKISQPFEQIWEPAYKECNIHKDRYEGCSIFWRRFQDADKHGIHFYDEDYHNYVGFNLKDCELDFTLEGQQYHDIEKDARFVLGKFKVKRFTRNANHIIYLLDKWTIWDRIRKDDVAVMDMLEHYNAAQIDEFINIAAESKAVQLTSELMTYKKEHFKGYDAFSEFVLEL